MSFIGKRDEIYFKFCRYNFTVTKITPFCSTKEMHKRIQFQEVWFCIIVSWISGISLKDPFRE